MGLRLMTLAEPGLGLCPGRIEVAERRPAQTVRLPVGLSARSTASFVSPYGLSGRFGWSSSMGT